MKKVNYEGKLYTIAELAELTGLTRSTVDNRFDRGWDVERVVKTPANHNLNGGKPVSKTEGEWYLDSLTRETLPASLKKLKFSTNGSRNVTKWGRHIRLHFKNEFDTWFKEEFLPSKTLHESKTE